MHVRRKEVVAIDSVGANAGKVVYYVTGSSARMTDTTKDKPSDATLNAVVAAIVDCIVMIQDS